MSLPHILVIEDNRNDQYVLTHLLSKFDYQADMVSTGEAAVAAIKKQKYAVILLDLGLSGVDGYECLRQIREIELDSSAQTPIIAITACADDGGPEKTESLGLSGYILKPFEPEDLRKMLLRHAYEPRRPNLKTLSPLSAEDSQFVESLRHSLPESL
ncbi:MAG: response regulator [Cyanobacteria bacterium REEB67]|nr:response regulator [Cyanobacteria bacterium REEB67]